VCFHSNQICRFVCTIYCKVFRGLVFRKPFTILQIYYCERPEFTVLECPLWQSWNLHLISLSYVLLVVYWNQQTFLFFMNIIFSVLIHSWSLRLSFNHWMSACRMLIVLPSRKYIWVTSILFIFKTCCMVSVFYFPQIIPPPPS
jgi:hypothetical protein